MRTLTESDVIAHFPALPEAVELMRQGLQAIADERASVTPKSQVSLADDGFANAMPASWPQRNLLGLKWVAIAPGNAHRNLPTIDGIVVLNDGTTGETRAIMPAAWLTGIRTAAVTGASLELDKRPVTFLGTGVQARSHAQVLAALGYEEMRVWGRRPEALAELAQWAAEHTPTLRLHTTTDRAEALAGAGVIISGLSFGATEQRLELEDLERFQIPTDATFLPLDYGTVVGTSIAKEAAASGGFAADDPEQFNTLRARKFPPGYPEATQATGTLLRSGRSGGLTVVQNLGSGLADVILADAIWQSASAAEGASQS